MRDRVQAKDAETLRIVDQMVTDVDYRCQAGTLLAAQRQPPA